jgi:hypothetical protein
MLSSVGLLSAACHHQRLLALGVGSHKNPLARSRLNHCCRCQLLLLLFLLLLLLLLLLLRQLAPAPAV